MSVLVFNGTHWTLWCCYKCAVEILVPEKWNTNRRNDGAEMYCINGHRQFYMESTVDKQRREIERLKQQQARLDDERREAEERAAKAERATYNLKRRIGKRRIGKGTCPCCKRSFANVQRHMKNKHPKIATLTASAV